VVFLDPIPYHPNIWNHGLVCVNTIDSDHWNPVTNLTNIVKTCFLLLSEPDTDDPSNADAAVHCKNNKKV
jgi:ubiquitin-protein ligase